jgi:DNA repair exonuclease SbcCD nuclease subunit
MNQLTRLATPLIAVATMTVPMMAQAQISIHRNVTQIHGNHDRPYQDGLLAARLDEAARRPIDPTQSHLYVYPPVKEEARDAYRVAFVIGYKTAVAEHPRSYSGE